MTEARREGEDESPPTQQRAGHDLRLILTFSIPLTVLLGFLGLLTFGPAVIGRVAASVGVLVSLAGWVAASTLTGALAERKRVRALHAALVSESGQTVLFALGLPLLVIGTGITFVT